MQRDAPSITHPYTITGTSHFPHHTHCLLLYQPICKCHLRERNRQADRPRADPTTEMGIAGRTSIKHAMVHGIFLRKFLEKVPLSRKKHHHDRHRKLGLRAAQQADAQDCGNTAANTISGSFSHIPCSGR